MKSDCVYFARGQVWWRRKPKDVDTNKDTSLYDKDRPCLIISSDSGNYSNNFAMVVPVTSSPKPDISVNVKYYNGVQGITETICCNQVDSVPLYDLYKYHCTLSEEVMNKVDVALAIAQSRERTVENLRIAETLDNIAKYLEKVCSERTTEYIKMDKDNTNEKFKEIASGLESILTTMLKSDSAKKSEITSVAPKLSVYSRAKEIKNTQSSSNKSEIKLDNSSTTGRKPHGFWTLERIKEFVEDKEKLSPSEYIKKWGFDSYKKAMNMYYNLKNKV